MSLVQLRRKVTKSVTTFKKLLNTHYSYSHIIQHKFECRMLLYDALAVTLWTCYGTLNFIVVLLLLSSLFINALQPIKTETTSVVIEIVEVLYCDEEVIM